MVIWYLIYSKDDKTIFKISKSKIRILEVVDKYLLIHEEQPPITFILNAFVSKELLKLEVEILKRMGTIVEEAFKADKRSGGE